MVGCGNKYVDCIELLVWLPSWTVRKGREEQQTGKVLGCAVGKRSNEGKKTQDWVGHMGSDSQCWGPVREVSQRGLHSHDLI